MQVRKQQLEPDMKRWAGSKSGKEYVKAAYCHPAYLTYMQSESESEVAQSCPTLCDPMDCSLPGSSLHGILCTLRAWKPLSQELVHSKEKAHCKDYKHICIWRHGNLAVQDQQCQFQNRNYIKMKVLAIRCDAHPARFTGGNVVVLS